MVFPSSLILKFVRKQITFDFGEYKRERVERREKALSLETLQRRQKKSAVALGGDDRHEKTLERLIVKQIYYDNPRKEDFLLSLEKLSGVEWTVDNGGIHRRLLTRQKRVP